MYSDLHNSKDNPPIFTVGVVFDILSHKTGGVKQRIESRIQEIKHNSL